jgi:hypothetical protein
MKMLGGMMHRDISEMARWWTKQSFAGDKGGSFNTSLYLEYLKCKNTCTDYYTSMKKGSQRAMSSLPKLQQFRAAGTHIYGHFVIEKVCDKIRY